MKTVKISLLLIDFCAGMYFVSTLAMGKEKSINFKGK
jgi:hypothetical protein